MEGFGDGFHGPGPIPASSGFGLGGEEQEDAQARRAEIQSCEPEQRVIGGLPGGGIRTTGEGFGNRRQGL